MWRVRESRRIGVRVFYEVYKEMPNGETVMRGKWTHKAEAQNVADKLNEEEVFIEDDIDEF